MKQLRLWAVCAGVAYTVFLWFFCISNGLHAGVPAEMGGQALGISPRAMALHQVWLLSARAAVALKLASPESSLNALSAIFAGAALCGLLVVFHRLLACAMSRLDVSTLFVAGDHPDAPQPVASVHTALAQISAEFTRREQRAVTFGTIGAALVYAFSAPSWVAATRAGSNSFDVLLLLFAVWLISSFCLKPTLMGACLASAVAGIGLAETPLFLAVGCALVFFYLRTVLYNELPFQTYFVAAVVSVCVGFSLQLGLASLLLRGSPGGGAVPLTGIVRIMMDGHFHALRAIQISPYWMWALLWSGTPFMIALGLSLSGQMENRLNVVTCQVLATVALAPGLLNFPYTPWSIWRGTGDLSVITSLFIVFAAGFLICRWWLLATLPAPAIDQSPHDTTDETDNVGVAKWALARFIGVGSFGCVAALILVQPWLNWDKIDPLCLPSQTLTEFNNGVPAVAGNANILIDPDADAHMLAGWAMELLDQGRVDEVEQVILPYIVRMRPALSRDRMELLRARVLLARGGRGLESARIFLLRLLQLDLPEEEQIGNWLLEVGLQTRSWDVVERDCQTIRRRNPLHARANEVFGLALINRGAPRLAIGYLQQTLNTITNAALLTVLGEAHLRLDETDQARTALEAATRQPDVGSEAYLFLARTLLKQGEHKAAMQVIQETPPAHASPELLLLHATLLFEHDRLQECRTVLEVIGEQRERLTVAQMRQWDALLRQTAGVERALNTENGHE